MSEEKKVELSYFGMIQQSTGEDWDDIALTLSTAEPLSVKSLPELERWFVDTKPLPVKQNFTNYSPTKNLNYQITYDQNWGLPAGTGSITGYVIDKATGEAIVGANIILGGTNFGSATDVNGKFYIANVPVKQYNLTASYIGYQRANLSLNVTEKNIANLTLPLEVEPIQVSEIQVGGYEVTITGERPLVEKNTTNSMRIINSEPIQEVKYTNVYAKELSTSFEIPSKSFIPSDNSQHKVTIAINRSPVEYSYTSIPKIVPSVYLKGKIVNEKDYPLLHGDINVFVDNDFINRTHLNTIVPTDTLLLALGIDERIQVKKILINKYQESKGLLGGSKQITYEYEIQILNNRKTEESVLIYDQVPITMNEDIKVELIEPQKEITELGNENKLEWNIKLSPGEKVTIPIKYQIVFPNNLIIYGLE
jgi:hypothetical protein